MYENTCNVVHRHSLPNERKAIRDLYAGKINSGERMLSYINRVQQLRQILNALDGNIAGKETAIAILNRLPSEYENLFTALDALGDKSSVFTLHILKSRFVQEDQRRDMHQSNALESVLFSSNRSDVPSARTYNCKILKTEVGHTEDRCWEKIPR